MAIHSRIDGDVQILDLRGALMLGEGDLLLREAIQRAIEGGHVKIVLNLEQLRRVDSSGLGEILASKKTAAGHGGDVKLLSPRRNVREVLLSSRLIEVLSVFDSEAEAVGAF